MRDDAVGHKQSSGTRNAALGNGPSTRRVQINSAMPGISDIDVALYLVMSTLQSQTCSLWWVGLGLHIESRSHCITSTDALQFMKLYVFS
jgi:hypothetical protein